MRACPALLLPLLSLAAACGREEVELDPPPPSPAAVSAPSEQDLTPAAYERVEEGYPMPGPERRRGEAAVALNATCEACHKDEADEWRRSRHRESNTNAAYRAAFAVEPSAFCTGCHAPEAAPTNLKANVNINANTNINTNTNTKIPERAVGELGVGCVTCHITEAGVVLAGAASSAGAAPHPLRRAAEFSKAGACAGCHEFRFPGATGDDDGHFMQTTAREHASSPGADKSCADCHMPIVAGRRSHAFAAVRDPAWLRENLRATASLTGDNRLRVTLTQPNPGHAFPTGDLFRRLEIGCETRDAAGKVIKREARHLARHFDILPGRPGRTLTRDDRVFAEPSVVEFEFLSLVLPAPAPSSRPPAAIAWWVDLQRVATVGTGENPADAKIESSVSLYSGVLPWEPNERNEREP